MNIATLLEQLIKGQDFTSSQMREFIQACMAGELTDAQIAAFLVLERAKGETIEELTVAAESMRAWGQSIDLGENLVDIVGTGGDGKNSFNVSTVSSFVAAAAGARMAKHGNRSVSSQSGSADLLLHAGFELELDEAVLQACMKQCGICFLFAQKFHPALKHMRNARQQLKIRTLINLVGPLLNPAHAKKQVVGVFSKDWLMPIANVLANLGSEHVLVLHSRDGLDEISISESTDVVEYHRGEFKQWTINPADYACFHQDLDAIVVQSAAESFQIAQSVFAGHKGPARDIVLLNAAAALYCADLTSEFSEALKRAAQAIDSGESARRFNQLKELTQRSKA